MAVLLPQLFPRIALTGCMGGCLSGFHAAPCSGTLSPLVSRNSPLPLILPLGGRVRWTWRDRKIPQAGRRHSARRTTWAPV